MYDPTVGRWLNLDPLGFDAGDANPTRYIGNGATNATDPSGLQPPWPPEPFPSHPGPQLPARRDRFSVGGTLFGIEVINVPPWLDKFTVNGHGPSYVLGWGCGGASMVRAGSTTLPHLIPGAMAFTKRSRTFCARGGWRSASLLPLICCPRGVREIASLMCRS